MLTGGSTSQRNWARRVVRWQSPTPPQGIRGTTLACRATHNRRARMFIFWMVSILGVQYLSLENKLWTFSVGLNIKIAQYPVSQLQLQSVFFNKFCKRILLALLVERTMGKLKKLHLNSVEGKLFYFSLMLRHLF